MPRDGVKSLVYRSFVTCDDPKGVVDCNSIKIYKTNPQKMEQKIKTHRTSRNPNKLLVSKVEKEELNSKVMRERFHGQSSLPLMEVYREAEKLNQIVDSWSKGMRSDGKSEDIAEDLLEGTSSLKESLVMLAKLQEGSNQSVRLKKYQRSFSCRLEDKSFPVEFQRSKLSRYGSSRNGADEIKKVIKDSLVSRNETCNVTVGEKSCFRDMNSDLGSDIPSTSSSQSSMGKDNVKCCHVSASPRKNLKGTNLIAKLMGLEEISSRPMQTTLKKEIEFEKIPDCRRSMFGHDTLTAWKSKSVITNKDPEKQTLREILETMPFHRRIESDSDKEFELPRSRSYNTCTKQRLKDIPPIVLIKPRHLPPIELEAHRAHVSLDEEAFDNNTMLRKMKKKELRSSDDSDSHGGILSSDILHTKEEVEGIPLKHITREGRSTKHRKEVGKLRKGTVGTQKTAVEILKTSSPIHNMPHEKEPVDKKVLTSKKVTTANRKPVEKEFVKEKVVSRPQRQEKVTSTNPRKNKTHTQLSTIPDSVSGRAVRAISNDQECGKREKAVLAHSEAKSPTCIVEAKKDDGSTDTNESAELPTNRNTNTLGALITREKETDDCDAMIIECCQESPNSPPPLSPKLEIDTSSKEVIDFNFQTKTDVESCEQEGTNLKALLLSSSSFLSQAREHFDLKLNGRTMLQASCCNDIRTPDSKAYIDCAIELVERRGHHHDLQVTHCLFLRYTTNTKIEISVEKLVEEVCDDIETLTSYVTVCGKSLLVDTVYAVLERDLCCKELMNGMWGFGWKNGFSRSEADEIVNDIEKMILSELVEESLA